jgi:hypothetical protein
MFACRLSIRPLPIDVLVEAGAMRPEKSEKDKTT